MLRSTCVRQLHRSLCAVAALAILVLAWAPARAGAQEEPQEQVAALGRVLGMTPAEIEALGLSPEEIENLLAGALKTAAPVGRTSARAE